MKSIIVTTPLKSSELLVKEAQKISNILGVPFIERNKTSIEQIKNQYDLDGILIISRDNLILKTEKHEYFYHPNMAKVRIKDIISGKPDQMVNAMNLALGDHVLDCTTGLASDALVSSFVVGEKGKIVGLENKQLIWLITNYGLQHYLDKKNKITEAMRRIETINANYNNYLPGLPDKSFDIVYFDPMFRRPKLLSSGINAFRALADPSPLPENIIREAVRVARKRIVMKESKESKEFNRLGFSQIIGGKYSPIAYGVIQV